MTNETTIKPIIGKEFTDIVIPEIDNATNTIQIIVFDWRWYPSDIGSPAQKFNQAIINAHKKGINCQVITNSLDVVEKLKNIGIKARTLSTKKLLHVKLMIIDEKTIIIGSHNYTQNAFTTNFELSVIITNCPEIDKYLTFFDNLK